MGGEWTPIADCGRWKVILDNHVMAEQFRDDLPMTTTAAIPKVVDSDRTI
jgi:hypothetical protein